MCGDGRDRQRLDPRPAHQHQLQPDKQGLGRCIRSGTEAYAVSDLPYQGEAANDPPPIGLTTPSSAFPHGNGAQVASGESGTASIVGTSRGTGDITYVEPEYAKTFGDIPVASVENASGDFVQPTPDNVSGALAYASGQSNGIQPLNFAGAGCNVYNPSTYSYLLARTDGSYGDAYGQALGGFINYVLTIGQKLAPFIDYPTIGLSLEQYGIQRAQNIPGARRSPPRGGSFVAGDVTLPSCRTPPAVQPSSWPARPRPPPHSRPGARSPSRPTRRCCRRSGPAWPVAVWRPHRTRRRWGVHP